MYQRKSLDQVKAGKTVLIPKEVGAKMRPLTVTSVLVRLFHRLLARRFERAMPSSHPQRGFKAGDSTNADVRLLQAIVQERLGANLPLPLAMVFIDMKKAFDSINNGAMAP